MADPLYRERLIRMRDAFPAPVSDRKHDAYFVFSIMRALDRIDAMKSQVPLLGQPRTLDYDAAGQAALAEEGRSVEAVAQAPGTTPRPGRSNAQDGAPVAQGNAQGRQGNGAPRNGPTRRGRAAPGPTCGSSWAPRPGRSNDGAAAQGRSGRAESARCLHRLNRTTRTAHRKTSYDSFGGLGARDEAINTYSH